MAVNIDLLWEESYHSSFHCLVLLYEDGFYSPA